ncbi:MAG: hypothetical protein CL677_07255 [Bdellovibrionaceae bacterium]|nr:hypothetical protein [Pseudobdellovibrionaceae bacterium]|tara:strand:- start:25551 stop:26501 length:951 start_codon:yes stop_codon:yes gene_type:complete
MNKEFGVIQTADPMMKNLLVMADNVAASKASILVMGESGTGKELLSRYIHAKSHRASKPFYAINCAAVPEGLIESELFGHEKGAFTGAIQRKLGKFELAHTGTFLLDEISELPLLLQSKLLRVIQESEIERVGGSQPIKVDVRLIATSNRDLKDMVKKGEFREDLFYRLNVIPLRIPALRERPQDIELLSQFFVEMACQENGLPLKRLSADALNKILEWKWPGNVRELRNVIERSVLLNPEQDIPAERVIIDETQVVANVDSRFRPGMTVAQAERMLILKTLDYTKQNRTQAARLLGISIRTLRNKINEYKQEVVA